MPDAYDRSRERWEPWQPEGMEMPVPEDPYELWSVAWGGDEFRVVFDGTNVRVVVIFDIDVVLSVRWAEESDRHSSLHYWVRSLEALGDDVEMPAGDLLFEVHDSEFQEWIHRESAYGYEVGTVRHFCLMGYNDFVDVLAFAEPNVELQYVSAPKQEG